MRVVARLACASLVKYCRGWFPFYSDVNICECHFSVTARYVKKKLPSLREVRNDTIWRTFERLGYSYKARRRKAAVAEKHKPARLAYCDWVEKHDQEDLDGWSYDHLPTGMLWSSSYDHCCMSRNTFRQPDPSLGPSCPSLSRHCLH